MNIKAIDTFYNGYKFRSRLEAKWAVFFNNANIEYEYEPEGYVTKGVCYLPDFYLPKLNCYAEVKRNSRINEISTDIIKCYKSIVWGGAITRIIFLSDIPEANAKDGMWCFPCIYYGCNGVDFGWWKFEQNDNFIDGFVIEREYDAPFSIAFDDENEISVWECVSDSPLKAVGENKIRENSSRYELRVSRLIEMYSDNENWYEDMRRLDAKNTKKNNPILFNALDKARQARFEYGEKG